VFENQVFIIKDVENPDKEITKAKLHEDGSLGMSEKSSSEELDKATGRPKLAAIKEATFESLKKIFGKEMQVLLNY